jgi:Tol biopolymer transport system component
MALVMSAATAAAPIYTAWATPVNLGSTINTSFADTNPALSPDGLSLYFDSSRPGGSGGRDLYASHRATPSAAWGTPVNLGAIVNSASDDANAGFSSDGHWLFFASPRPGGFGAVDLYQSYRADIHDDLGWEAPTNLGSNVNTAANEQGTGGYFDNGGHPQLYFGSNRPGGLGGPDIYRTDLQPDGTWGVPVPVTELNSTDNDNRPNLRADGLEIFFYSARPGGVGGSDLWTATRAATDATWSTPVNLGATVNTSASDAHPYLSADGTTLVLDSTRPGGFGADDLWVTTRAQIFPTSKDECKNGGFERFGIFTNQGDCVSYVVTGGGNQPG